MTRCPLCAAPAPPPFLRRDSVPVHQNRTAATRTEALAMPRGTLALCACPACGFVFNRSFDPALPGYGPGYDNTQSLSPAFAAHLDSLARHLTEVRGVRGAHIVEVGCGQGDFLRRLVAYPGADNTGTGLDPSYRGPVQDAGGRLSFERRLYGPDCARPADAVVCRHVIEHVADPLALLRTIRAAAPTARVFFETPDADWILRQCVPWDLFYEHCSLFTAGSLADAFGRAGYTVTGVRHVFGGQYLWLEAEPGPAAAHPAPGETAALASAFAARETALVAAWRAQLAQIGRVVVWGAGAKGATLASLADPQGVFIGCLVDINPAKQGRYLPGTGHAIVAPAELAARGVRHVLPMNPLYRAEIDAMLPHGVALAEWAD